MMAGTESFDPPAETLKMAELLKLHKRDLHKPSTALSLCGLLGSVTIFERALVYHPHLPSLWASYLTKFPDPKLAARAVRFCPISGLLWSLQAKIAQEINSFGFKFLSNLAEAQLLLGQLIAIDQTSAVSLIREALKFDIFSEGDNWIWPTLLLEEQLKRNGSPIEERRTVLMDCVERNPQNLEMWLKLADFEFQTEGEQASRDVFQRASQQLKLNLPDLMQKWIAFEACATHGCFEQVLARTIELGIQKEEPGTSLSEDYERRTVFVANLAPNCNSDDLQRLFAQAGEIEGVRLKDKHGKRAFAFVQFRTADDADNAVKMLSGAMLQGQPLDVRPHKRPQILTLFIWFAAHAQPGSVIEFLRENTGISSFKLRLANEGKNESRNRTKGWGFIDVKSEQDALKFMALNGRVFETQALKIEVARQNQKERFVDKKRHPRFEPKAQSLEDETHSAEDERQRTQKQSAEKERMADAELRDFFGFV
jgi:RNA recognition motif-containing protein